MSSSTSSSAPQATRGPNGYFPSPFTTDPLPGHLRTTLVPVATMALMSFLSTFGLICFIAYRMVFWRKYYRIYPGYNQYLLLIFNLVLADFQQSIGFLISFHWIAQNRIVAPTAACIIQGWLIQVGDVSSGIWVLSIALHTWYSVVMGRKVKHIRFCCCVVGIWIFVILLGIIGPSVHPKTLFVSTGAWCWINQDYPKYRLGLHYFWILLCQFGSVVVYSSIFCLLRRSTHQVPSSSRSASSKKINRAARFMVLYPIAYITLSLPLPAGRLAVWNGAKVSLTYYCIGATLMTSCGFVDTIMYTLTRRVLASEIGDSSSLSSGNEWRDRTSVATDRTGEQGAAMDRRTTPKRKHDLHTSDSIDDIWLAAKSETVEMRPETLHQERISSSPVRDDR